MAFYLQDKPNSHRMVAKEPIRSENKKKPFDPLKYHARGTQYEATQTPRFASLSSLSLTSRVLFLCPVNILSDLRNPPKLVEYIPMVLYELPERQPARRCVAGEVWLDSTIGTWIKQLR